MCMCMHMCMCMCMCKHMCTCAMHHVHALRLCSQAEALRAAMLAVRKARSWEPPLFWAGYTLLGVSNGI